MTYLARISGKTWPQWFPAEDMKMEMKDRLAGIRTGVCQHTIAGFADAFPLGNLDGKLEELTGQGPIIRAELVERLDMAARNHQDVGWRLRMEVAKRHGVRRLGNEFRSKLTPDNLAKDAIRFAVVVPHLPRLHVPHATIHPR
jgi:hypothetical protein